MGIKLLHIWTLRERVSVSGFVDLRVRVGFDCFWCGV